MSSAGGHGGGGTVIARTDDLSLVTALAACGCQGELWDVVERDLARYGIGTLRRLFRDPGRLAALTLALGRPIRLTPAEVDELTTDPGAADRLIADAVIKGLQLFRDHAVLGGQWQPTGGASLQTYFVNGCLLALANVVRAWCRSRARIQPCSPRSPEAFDLVDDVQDGDPLHVLVAQEDVARTLEWLGPDLARAAVLRLGTGGTWAEVAEQIGLTRKALERKLDHFRQNHDPRGPETER